MCLQLLLHEVALLLLPHFELVELSARLKLFFAFRMLYVAAGSKELEVLLAR